MPEPIPSTVGHRKPATHEPQWSAWAYILGSSHRPEQWDRWCWEPYCGATQTSLTKPEEEQ